MSSRENLHVLVVVSVVVMALAAGSLLAGPGQHLVPPVRKATPTPQPETDKATPDSAAKESVGEVMHRNYLEFYYTPWKVPKNLAIPKGGNLIQPSIYMPGQLLRVIGEEGDDYIVQNLPIEDPRSFMHMAWRRMTVGEAGMRAAQEARGEEFAVWGLPDVLPPFVDALDFEVSRKGLPQSGLWQVSFDVVDVNKDGKLDMVLPPPRMGGGNPTVVLGDGQRGFRVWESCRWPSEVRTDYGTVRAADLDGDGHIDIALSSHFQSSVVFYGDGKGDFRRHLVLPTRLNSMTSKALAIADFDRDGKTDIVLHAELDMNRNTGARFNGPLVNVLLNRPGRWDLWTDGMPQRIFGDHVVAGDLNRDGYSDIVAASQAGGNRQIVLLNPGRTDQPWRPIAELEMPFGAFVYSVAIGNICHPKGGADAVLCFEQVNESNPGSPANACVLYHFHDERGRFVEKPTPEVLLKDHEPDYFLAADLGDVDGDGRLDIVVGRASGELRLLLQRQPGRFLETSMATSGARSS
jgi:hypothetical protein